MSPNAGPVPPNGNQDAQAGLDCFKGEDYLGAVRHYKAAIQAGGTPDDCRDWRAMLALADANATAKINVEIPKPVYFKRETLLERSPVRDGDLPRPPRHRPGHGCFRRLWPLLWPTIAQLPQAPLTTGSAARSLP